MALHTLKPADVMKTLDPGRYSDGGGLFLHVRSATARSWIVILHDKGKRHELSIGPAVGPGKAGMSLVEARDAAEGKRRLRTAGQLGAPPVVVPIEGRSFEQVANEWFDNVYAKEVTPKTLGDEKSSVERHAAKLLKMDVRVITKTHIVGVLEPVWHSTNRTARDLRFRLETILNYARAKDYIAADAPNAADWSVLQHLLPDVTPVVEHHDAVPYAELPAVMRTIRSKNQVAARALEFATLCAVRPTECRGARVREIDFVKNTWTVPVARLKVKEIIDKNGKTIKAPDHIVPLSRQAIRLLKNIIPNDAEPDDLIFEGEKAGQMIGHNAMTHTLQRVADGTAHGMRASFSTWRAEQTKYDYRLSEAALAHVFKSETEKAYDRSPYVEQRRPLMQDWADYLDGV
ncbi:site-specific integrase [Bradyrhizobium sp. 174]|uniref:tyrosine-type recombinase/integrase n=1 Tax=Bradyrhizobium sp. 174 TaxID=2782645 RepID=UPI001FFC002B|nr:site-specific integrase [Bradyrhizobium sp. 174]MCK1570326.1 tyrosine-type recombinase/integrase [Bradyrhizobium sp. 174]